MGLLAPEPRRGAAIPRQFHREPARHRVRHGDRAAHARALLSPHHDAGRVGLLGNRRAARRVQRAHRGDRSGAAAGDRPAGRRGAQRRAGPGAGEAGGRPRLRLVPIAWTTTIPASALTGRVRPEIALAAALVAALAFALARALWRAALKRYAGASG